MSVRTWTLPSSTRPAAGAALAVTEPGTVHRAGRTQRVGVGDADRAEGRVGEHVDVVVVGGARRHGEAVDQHHPGPGSGVGDRHRFLGVAVGGLPGQHARAARAVEHEQVEVGGRVGRVADRRAEACAPGRDADRELLLREVGDRRRSRSGAAQRRADGPAGERAEQVGQRVAAGDRHAERGRGDDVGVRRDGGAEDRHRQRERRVGDVRGAPGLDGDLPDPGLRLALVRLSGLHVTAPSTGGE